MENVTRQPLAVQLAIRSVRDLCATDESGNAKYRFHVPKYQRGYRWTDKQVIDLLEDIDAFTPTEQREGVMSWYCLQPLVIRYDCDNGRYNLVDGQQRLTTIFLLLHYLKGGLVEKRRNPIYELSYATRPEWLCVLQNGERAADNIDFWHIDCAYRTIRDWFTSHQEVDEDGFHGKLLAACRFIWCDIDQDGISHTSEEDVFIRLNVGKIPLTNAELVKALFLNRSNFGSQGIERIRLHQLEISTQWDGMEEELANDVFWHFINGRTNLTVPRINYFFDVIALVESDEKNVPRKEDGYFTFRHFQKKIDAAQKRNEPAEFIMEEWQSVYSKFQILRDWFRDRFCYHHIGFLLTDHAGRLVDLMRAYAEIGKRNFRERVRRIIQDDIRWNGEDIPRYVGGGGKNRVKRILLLHNILTAQNHEKDGAWFPFNLYHTTNWDIEHIQAIADPEMVPKGADKRKLWLESALGFIKRKDAEIKKFAMAFTAFDNEEEFIQLYEKIIAYFSATDTQEADPMSLANLALLDFQTNRGYSNAVFPAKRAFILEKDKSDCFRFIPVCTKHVFHKYYTRDTLGDLTRWTMKDRGNYLADIKTMLEPYLLGKDA